MSFLNVWYAIQAWMNALCQMAHCEQFFEWIESFYWGVGRLWSDLRNNMNWWANMGNSMDDMHVCTDRWADCGPGPCRIFHEERRAGSLYHSTSVCLWRDGDPSKDSEGCHWSVKKMSIEFDKLYFYMSLSYQEDGILEYLK